MQHAVMARRIALFDLAVDPPALCNEQRARLAESERGLDIEPLAPEQDAPARLAAQKLFGQIEWNAREVCWLCAENGWPTRVANASI